MRRRGGTRLPGWTMRRRIRKSVNRNPLRLVLQELERKETASETLNFLAGGLTSPAVFADPSSDGSATVRTSAQVPTDFAVDSRNALAATLTVRLSPPAQQESSPQQPQNEGASNWSGTWGAFADNGDDDFSVPVSPAAGPSVSPDAPHRTGGDPGAIVSASPPAP